MMYYGISMNSNVLGGNLYLTFILGALMEIPANIVVFFVIDRIGRKLLIFCGLIAYALALLTNLLFDYVYVKQGKDL